MASLTALNSLDLRSNEIGPEGASALASLTALNSLDLSYNKIGNEGACALASLTALNSLDLNSNEIGPEGASALASLTALTSLDLSSNKIGPEGASALASLTALTSLDLYSNEIGNEGASALASLTALTSLDLYSNKIGNEGASALASLTALNSLNLFNNRIGNEGANALASLTALTSLDLSSNKIGPKGASALASLTALNSLELYNNSIGDEGASALVSLSALTSLDLYSNNIGDKGASALASLTALNSLDLGSNNIGDEGASGLASLTALNLLDLSSNKIGDKGACALASLTALTTLDLYDNKIGDEGACALKSLTTLTSLNLSSNKIGNRGASALASLTALTTLNLGNTEITDLSPFLSRMKGKMVVTTKQIGPGLIVYECPLVHPPVEIASQGRKAILNYFSELEAQGSDRLFEAKVLLLGEGRAGKTSLLRRLYQPGAPLPVEDETTKGIEIHHHDFTMDDGRDFRLNVWDFGGQQIYHATHQFFLTRNSLYVLVDDTAKDHKSVHDDGFKYWLEIIETFSERSPVLIFQNEKGGRSKTIDQAGIKGRFPNVMDIYSGNLNEPNAANNLEAAIRLQVQQLPHIGDEVPAKWIAIREALEERAKETPTITQDEYFAIYGEHLEFDRTKALHLSGYLHNLGVFLHFQEERRLKRTVILQNRWATEAVFRMLDDETVKKRFGRFTAEDCDRVWDDSGYVDSHEELLALIEKFELCYLLSDASCETWLAPQLLSPSTPPGLENWGKPGDLVLSYRYDFLPKGLINRLMVRMNRFVQNPEQAWRNGVLFEQGKTQVLVVEEAVKGDEIILRARGPERKELLSVIASDLNALNASFEGLKDKVEKLVPCICEMCAKATTPKQFEEQDLLIRKHRNKHTIECPESYEDVSVLELLDGIRIETLPKWGEEPLSRTESDEDSSPQAFSNRRTIRIFLASSEELRDDRDAFDLYVRQQNDRLHREGIYLEVVRWENFLDAMSETRKQDDYNDKVRNCDLFVSLFMTKTGKYTEEEFDVAHQTFSETKKPQIYTYFKDAPTTTGSVDVDAFVTLGEFKKKLSDLGHFYTSYETADGLTRQFRDQFDKLLDEGKI